MSATATPGQATGGMGAYSPAPVMTAEMVERTMKEIIEPTVRGMAESGYPFTGVFFAGLMITEKARSSSNTMSASAIPNARC